MSVIQSPFRLSRKTRGFTLIEVLVVIAIIGILSVLGFVSYNGLQQRAAENGALSDLENAASVIEQYALKNGGEFPNSEYLSSNFTTTKGVNLSVVLSDAGDSDGTTTYTNLSPVQNGVLFYNLCSEIVNENRPDQPSLKYGQGINNGNQITTYIIGPNPCGVYNPTRIQVNSTWNPANFDTPITASSMQNFISSIHNTDAWFPDREHVEKQFYQEWNDRFLAKGGTYPITTFWHPQYGCNAFSCWNTPGYEALPELPNAEDDAVDSDSNELTKRYCIIATHEKYNDILYSFSSSSLSPKVGNCAS